jgi:aerobic-type carbon monoxide dehydrogenase small subunit (CoxS/CutS family)
LADAGWGSAMRFTVNGRVVDVDAEATDLLLDVVRSLGLTGTKEGCGVGVCGACTVLVHSLPVSSCLFFAGCAEGAEVTTVEGVAEREPALVAAFAEAEGFQCGICTPGLVMAALALALSLEAASGGGSARRVSDDDIREHMAGNLCRCTGYVTIIESVRTYLARR